MPNSLQPHGLQHARLPCPSLSLGVCSDSTTESMMPSNHLILCRPLLLPSIFPSIMIFSNELAVHIRWPRYWSFSFSNSPSNSQCWLPLGLSGLISLLSKGLSWVFSSTRNSESSILRHLAFFMVQLTHLYMTTGKTISFDYMHLCQQSSVSAF